MKIKITLLIFLFSIQLIGQNNYQRIKLIPTESEILLLQKSGIDVSEGFNSAEGFIESDYSEKEAAIIDKVVVNYEVLYKNSNDFYNQKSKNYKSGDALDFSCFDPNQYSVPQNFDLGTYGGFFTYQEILDHLDNMYNLYPNLISQKQTIGNFLTHQNNTILYTTITGSASNTNKPKVLFNSLHHSREPITVSQNIYFMYYLLENYGTDSDVTYLLDNTEIHFVPCLNPDGYLLNESLYSYDPISQEHTFGFFRKNGRDNNGDGIFERQNDGVDLNRNYGYNWGLDDGGSSPNPTSQTYRGPAAFSEPETQAMKFLCEENNYVMAFNYHSYGNLLLYPWGYDSIETPDGDKFCTMAELMTSQNNYEFGVSSIVIYKTNGDADDWMYGEQSTKDKIYCFTPEVGSGGDGFYPAQERIVELCNETLGQNLYALKCLHNHLEVKAQIDSKEITAATGFLKFDYKKYGLETGSNEISIGSNNPNISILGSINTGSLNIGDFAMDSIAYQINASIPYGTTIDFTISIDNGAHIYQIPFSSVVKIGTPANVQIVSNGFDDSSNWTTDNGWGLTDLEYHSPPYSIADSPYSYAQDLQNNTLTITDTLDLSNARYAELSFWAMHEMQQNHDYVELIAYDIDNQSQTTLCGKYTTYSEYLALGYPVYTGDNDTWFNEKIGLHDFIGKRIQIQFVYNSNLYINYDGFYLDDVEVEIVQQSALTSNYDCRIFLEGCYLSNATMRTDITDLIPNNQPFSDVPYNYMGSESFSSIPSNAVDWVLVEARTGIPNETIRGTTTIEQRAALLLSDGSLLGPNGQPGVDFLNLNSTDSYYFCIRHRNHLDILSRSSTMAAPNISQDFTISSTAAFGTNQLKQATDGRFVMYTGDYTGDGVVLISDFDLWKLKQAELATYRYTDGNLDGNVSITDFDSWFYNQAKLGVAEIRD